MDQLAEYRHKHQERWQQLQQQEELEVEQDCTTQQSVETSSCDGPVNDAVSVESCVEQQAAPRPDVTEGSLARGSSRPGSSGLRAVSAIRAARLAADSGAAPLPGAAWPGHPTSAELVADTSCCEQQQQTQPQLQSASILATECCQQFASSDVLSRCTRSAVGMESFVAAVGGGVPRPPIESRSTTSAFVRNAHLRRPARARSINSGPAAVLAR